MMLKTQSYARGRACQLGLSAGGGGGGNASGGAALEAVGGQVTFHADQWVNSKG